MNSLRLFSACTLLCALVTSPNLCAAEAQPQLMLDRLVAQLQMDAKIPGGAIAIIDNQRIYTRTFGQRGLQDPRPVDASTVFRIASLSKTFTSALAAMLVSDGAMAWESRVQSALPELGFGKPATNQGLRFGHLLSHSTGVLPYAFDQQLETPTTLAKILPQFRKAPIVCNPGKCYGYQNSLFSVSALMMEKQTGQSFAQLLQTRIFTPLQMQDSSTGYTALQAADNLAWPHIADLAHWKQVPISASYYAAAPAAGVNSSIKDMGIWLAAQLGFRPSVLAENSLEMLRQPRIKANKFASSRHWQRMLSAEHYGYGWRVLYAQDEPIIFHAGWVQGYSAQISYAPKHRVGMVILLNAEHWLNSVAVDFWCEELRIKTGKQFCKPAEEIKVDKTVEAG